MSTQSTSVIKFTCPCGAKMKAPATAAGRRARCPRCKAPSVVPAPGADSPAGDDDLLSALATGQQLQRDEARDGQPLIQHSKPASEYVGIAPAAPISEESRLPVVPEVKGPPQKCRCCHKEYPASAKLCTDCGIYLKTGRGVLAVDDEHLNHAYSYTENILWYLSFIMPLGFSPFASVAFGLRKPWVIPAVAVVTTFVSCWFFVAYIYTSERNEQAGQLMLWNGIPAEEYFAEELAKPDPADQEFRGITIPGEYLEEFVQLLPRGEYQSHQLVTHALLHGGIFHLAGNLLFLMVLGARVNSLIGNILTAILYPILAIAAAALQLAASSHEILHPMLGASGAIMGLAGMYMVLMPSAKIHIVAWIRIVLYFSPKTFALHGFWVVAFYIAFDVIYTLLGTTDNVARWAHLGGFFAGAGIALLLLLTRAVNARGHDLLSVVMGPAAWAFVGRPNRPAITLW